MKPAPKTYAVKSFGCQMNVYDGERMGELMAAGGMTATDDANAADLVVLNTCHIREKATEKVYSDVGRLRKTARKAGRDPLIAIAGCVAQAEGVEIAQRSGVNIVVGPQAYHNLPDLVAKAARGGERSMKTGSSTQGFFALFSIATAASAAAWRSVSKVPRLISRASARLAKPPISRREMVIEGIAPAASSTLAVKVCATALVTQCTRGARSRTRARISAAMSGSSRLGDCISSPSAGMIRIRFAGW